MAFVSTFDHTNSMTDKMTFDRADLQNNFIQQMLDDMDIKTMMACLYDFLDESYDKYSDEELITEVKEYYPELMDD
jgi:hypothetical protein